MTDNIFIGYIDDLMATKHFVGVAIVGRDGSAFAATAGVVLSCQEINALVGLNDPSVTQQVASVELKGQFQPGRYVVLRRDADGAMLKKGGAGSGVITFCTSKLCLIGFHDDKTKAETARSDLSRLADFLVKKGS